MWNNLLVFSGICLFSLNFLSSSKSMEFPSTKFNLQQTWKNQHRADTSSLRKLTRNASRLHAATSKLHRKQIKNNENIIHLGKETKNFHKNFLNPRGIRSHSKNYFTGEFINDRKLAGNYATKNGEHLETKNSFQLCFSNHSNKNGDTKEKKIKSYIPMENVRKLRSMSSNNATYVNNTISRKSPQIYLTESTPVPVQTFLSQLSLNGCANNTCEINPVENSIGDRHLLNVSNRRRNVFDGNRKNDAKNFNSYDNQINENLMRTKRAVLKAHRRPDTTEKILGSRFNISVTDYPINVNFRSYTRQLNKNADHSTDHTSLPSVTTSKPRTANLAASQAHSSGKSTKEPIKNTTDSKANEKKPSESQLIKNQYPAKYVENHRYRTVIKNHKHSRTKRQADEKTLQTSTTLTRISTQAATERIEINESKATSTEYYDSMETRKNTNVTIPLDVVNKSNNLKNKTATNIIKRDDKMKISSLNETTKKPSPLPSENLTLQNYTNVNANLSESEKLRRLASSCGASAANITKKTIFILGLFALTNGPSERIVGQSEIAAASLAIEHINQMQILGCEYELKMLVNNTQEDPGVALNNFFYAMYKDQHQKRIKALLGSSNAEVTHALAKITLAWDIPTISFGYSSPQLSDNKKYPMFFRTVAPDSSHNQARIAFLHYFKWNAVMTICQQQDLYSWGINDLSTKLEESNITQEKTISFSEQDFEAHLKLMPEQDSKIIVASFSNDVAPKFFCTVYDMGLYGGDYVWILPGTLENRWWNTNKYCTKQKLIKAVNGLILISSKKQLDEDEYAVSFVNEEEFQNLLPKMKSQFVREAYDAVWATALSLNLTLSSCNESIDCLSKSFHKSFQKQFVNNFQFIQFKGTSGPILFHGADRICITNFYQIQDGEIFPIAQYDPLTLKLNFNCSNCKDIIWPSGYIPVSKRTYELHIMNITPVAFYVINSFAVLGILVSLCFLVFNIYYREQKYIKLSSPYLNATTIMGCVLVYLAVIFLGIDNSTMPPAFTFQTICTARVALLSTGCSLAFGSIFAKTYRVHQIFIKSNHGILKSKVLQDSRLVPIIGVFVLIDGVIIVIWTAIDPMELDFYNLTLEASVVHPEIIHQLQVEVCKSEYKNTWLFALGIYKAVFFILGLYMAWETRNVKIPSLNDSEYIGLTVYTVLVTTVLHFTLANVTSDRITLAYVTTTSLILFTTTSSMCLLFLPKINAIFRNKDSAHKKIVSSTDLKIESNTIRFVKNDDQEPYYRVHIQNFAYRKYVAFLDREIQNLHYKVYIKKNDDPDLMARRATKIYDKLPNLRKYRREKSSSLCGGIPNLFMLTVFPVVIPRASWPYAEHLDRPITEEMAFSSETKLQSIRFQETTLNRNNDDSEDEDQPKCDGSVPNSPLKRIFDNDEYQDTSSDVEEDHNHPSSVLKICKAIVHSPLSDEELKRLEQTPRIMITDTDEVRNHDNNEIDVNQQLEI